MKKIINIFGWIILLLAFASLGLSSDDPTFGFLFYLGFFLIVFFIVFLYIKKHQKRKEADRKSLTLTHKILGILLVVIALFSPLIALNKIGLPFTPNLLIFLATVVLVVLGALGVHLINRGSYLKILGLLLIVVLSVIPAIFAITFLEQFFPNAYNALGTAYWAVLTAAVLAWWGFSLFYSRE